MPAGYTFLECVAENRSLRAGPHKRHIAFHHIPELRNLVESRLPKLSAKRRHARIAFRRPPWPIVFRIDIHASELVYAEGTPFPPDPYLGVDGRTRAFQLDMHSNQCHRHRQHSQGCSACQYIEYALYNAIAKTSCNSRFLQIHRLPAREKVLHCSLGDYIVRRETMHSGRVFFGKLFYPTSDSTFRQSRVQPYSSDPIQGMRINIDIGPMPVNLPTLQLKS